MIPQTPPDEPSPGRFPTTQWSRVISAGDPDAPQARESLADLCNAYWYPLYAYIRRRGYDPEQAKDLTQDFFARALEKGLLAQADPARGRFRSFLLVSLKHFLDNEWTKERALKRGGGRFFVSWDDLPPGDREAVVVEQLLDAEQRLHVAARVHALATRRPVPDKTDIHRCDRAPVFLRTGSACPR